jgi:hypothetical protein
MKALNIGVGPGREPLARPLTMPSLSGLTGRLAILEIGTRFLLHHDELPLRRAPFKWWRVKIYSLLSTQQVFAIPVAN